MWEWKMPLSKSLRWGHHQFDWKSTLILALISSQILETSYGNALYITGEIDESFPIQIQEDKSKKRRF